MSRLSITILAILMGHFLGGCNKTEFLAEKPSTSLLVPKGLDDFQKMLDANEMMVSGILGEISSDNYYIIDEAGWASITNVPERNAYIWAKDIYEGYPSENDWSYPYKQVLRANIVLEGLERVTTNKESLSDYSRIKGWALFLRGHAFYNLAQHFAPTYDKLTASEELGIPLRLEADVSAQSVRSTVEETYQQILKDLQQASYLLPDKDPATDRNRPYKSAALGLLARVHLVMGDYSQALNYADSCLTLYNKLMDYNTISVGERIPISNLNEETLFYCRASFGASRVMATYLIARNTIVDSILYDSYKEGDLRKTILFQPSTSAQTFGKPLIYGSYSGSIHIFTGIATDEIYLIKAECLARLDNYHGALNTLNTLLQTRWDKAYPYEKYTAQSSSEALDIILEERRKELPFRGLRWSDLRRLNKEGRNIILKRQLGENTFVLQANSPSYVLPIPPEEVRLSGIQQNDR